MWRQKRRATPVRSVCRQYRAETSAMRPKTNDFLFTKYPSWSWAMQIKKQKTRILHPIFWDCARPYSDHIRSRFGYIWNIFGPWGNLGANFWGILGASWGVLGASLEPLAAVLTSQWAFLMRCRLAWKRPWGIGRACNEKPRIRCLWRVNFERMLQDLW